MKPLRRQKHAEIDLKLVIQGGDQKLPATNPSADAAACLPKKVGDDVHEKYLHDRHSGNDHRVSDVCSIGGRELVRVGKDGRVLHGSLTWFCLVRI